MALWQLKCLGTWCIDVFDVQWTSLLYIKICWQSSVICVYTWVLLETEGSISNHPMLTTVVLLLFKLENKKELHEEVNKSQWSALRGMNWQHSKSYIMLEPTDLFSHTIFFAKFNMLTSLSLHFLVNIEGAYTFICFSSGARA